MDGVDTHYGTSAGERRAHTLSGADFSQKLRKPTVSKEEIEKELRAAKNDFKLPLYEDRVFRAIVYPKYRSIKPLFRRDL